MRLVSQSIFMASTTLLSARASTFPTTPACPNPVELPYGVGCSCTSESCGTYPDDPRPRPSRGLLITTGPNEGFLKHEELVPIKNSSYVYTNDTNAAMTIKIDLQAEYQEILGFGAAVTDASAYVLTEVLDAEVKDKVLRQAFDYAGWNMARVPMNSADFSRMDYSMAHLLDLSDFCLRDDRTPDGETVICGEDYKLDVLEEIVNEIEPDLKVFVSSWSAPPSFKTQKFTCEVRNGVNECVPDPTAPVQVECIRTVSDPTTCINQPISVPCNTTPPHDYELGFPVNPGLNPRYNANNIPHRNANGNCYNTGFIKEDAYEAWALFYAKFLEAYSSRGVHAWDLTSQNEPYTQTGLWQSNFWTVDGMVRFVNEHLAPAVRQVLPDIHIMMYDDQLLNLTDAAIAMMTDTQEVASGIGFHWYTTLESGFENTEPVSPVPGLGLPLVGGGAGVKTAYDAFNGTKFLLMTESCSGYALGTEYQGPRHGSFAFGYNTAHDMLWDFRNRAAGYVYWNLILDDVGGPNLAGNYVDSPMYVKNASTVIMNPSFFYLAHFSRFVPPGSVAIDAEVDCGADEEAYCQYVAFRTPDHHVVLVLTNDEVTTNIVFPLPLPPLAQGQGGPIDWTIQCGGSTFQGTLPWQTVQTVVLDCSGQGKKAKSSSFSFSGKKRSRKSPENNGKKASIKKGKKA